MFFGEPEQDKDRFIYQRIVAKFGTQLLTQATRHLYLATMASLLGQIARLHQAGVEIIVVSSGARLVGRSHSIVESDFPD